MRFFLVYVNLITALMCGSLGPLFIILSKQIPAQQLNPEVLGYILTGIAIVILCDMFYLLGHYVDKISAKKIGIEFFYWWWNRNGSNTGQGFDEWWDTVYKKEAN